MPAGDLLPKTRPCFRLHLTCNSSQLMPVSDLNLNEGMKSIDHTNTILCLSLNPTGGCHSFKHTFLSFTCRCLTHMTLACVSWWDGRLCIASIPSFPWLWFRDCGAAGSRANTCQDWQVTMLYGCRCKLDTREEGGGVGGMKNRWCVIVVLPSDTQCFDSC